MIKFYRGLESKYVLDTHGTGIYFATDSGKIIHNGSSFSGVLDSDKPVKNVSVENGVLTITYHDSTTQTYNLTEKIPAATASIAGLMSSADKTFIDGLNNLITAGSSLLSKELAEILAQVELGDFNNVVKSVSGNVLTLSNAGDLSTAIELKYNTTNKHIELIGKDNANLGYVDATNFIKDGMLDDVEVVTIVKDAEGNIPEGTIEGAKYIKFTWNTDGDGKTDYIAVSDLAKTYTAGTAIDINDSNQVSVIIGESTESSVNYLKNESGLKVTEMGANVTKLKSEIQIQGGPLANTLKNIYSNNIIPAGTPVEEILMKMVCKEIFPTVSTSQGSISASMSLTTLEFNPTDTTVEVGTIVTTNAITADGSTQSNTPAKIKDLTNGYALSEDGSIETNAQGTKLTTKEYAVTNITEASNTHKITFTYSGFSETAPTAVTAASSVTMPTQTLVVREGSCSVSVSATGSKFTAKSPAVSQEYWNISNINGRLKETKTISAKDLSSTASASTSDSVTGVYKYFMGYYDFASNQNVVDVFTSDIIRNLKTHTGNITKDSTTTLVGTTGVTSNGKSIVVAVPSKYKLSQFKNDLGGSELANFSKTGTVKVAHPTNTAFTTDYTVYVWPVAGGATITYKEVQITKA